MTSAGLRNRLFAIALALVLIIAAGAVLEFFAPTRYYQLPVSYTHLTLPTILRV